MHGLRRSLHNNRYSFITVKFFDVILIVYYRGESGPVSVAIFAVFLNRPGLGFDFLYFF